MATSSHALSSDPSFASGQSEDMARSVDSAHVRDDASPESSAVLGDKTGTDKDSDPLEPASTAASHQTMPDYSRGTWDEGRKPADVFWTVSLEEFRAMDDDQWKAFGTSFYVPPPGFNTAKRHVVKLE